MIVALVLVVVALLHVSWGLGGRWPAKDDAGLAALVVGTRGAMPSPLACHVVAVLLGIAAVLVASASGAFVLPMPPIVTAIGAWGVVLVLGARGLGGFVEARFRPEVRELPYHRWNLVLYSPLCLAVAGLAALGIAR
ncbi:MAG: DUF3995 domain-containing protein [Myxococcota bacterium]|nr:DUF3995 domain-containing protein [Myxococcota bacterium]